MQILGCWLLITTVFDQERQQRIAAVKFGYLDQPFKILENSIRDKSKPTKYRVTLYKTESWGLPLNGGSWNIHRDVPRQHFGFLVLSSL